MLLFSRCTTNSSYIWCGLVLRFRITDPRDLFTSDSSIFAFFTYQAPLDGRKMSSLSPYYLLLRVTYKIKAWGRCIRPTTVPSSAQIAHSYLFFVSIYLLNRWLSQGISIYRRIERSVKFLKHIYFTMWQPPVFEIIQDILKKTGTKRAKKVRNFHCLFYFLVYCHDSLRRFGKIKTWMCSLRTPLSYHDLLFI